MKTFSRCLKPSLSTQTQPLLSLCQQSTIKTRKVTLNWDRSAWTGNLGQALPVNGINNNNKRGRWSRWPARDCSGCAALRFVVGRSIRSHVEWEPRCPSLAEGPESRDDTPPPQPALHRSEWPLARFISAARPAALSDTYLQFTFIFIQ